MMIKNYFYKIFNTFILLFTLISKSLAKFLFKQKLSELYIFLYALILIINYFIK